jgi:RecB family exonuclease/fructose-specific component phosphotransferase system IIB-like protein
MHATVERFFKVRTPHPPSMEELLQFYEQSWLSAGYASPEEEAKYKDYGRQILKKFHDIHAPDFRLPVATERGFMLGVNGIKLRGFIDRVDKLDSGGLSIVDYKTNQELFTADYVENDLQLTIYQMAAEQTWKLPVEKLTLYHLRSNTPCTCPPRPPSQLEDARRLVLDVAENITKGNFPATENQYCPCDFAEHCPYHKHQYLIAQPPAKARQEQLPGLVAADAVEKYASLQAQIKELQAQLDEVKQSIIDYCQTAGLNRVFGSTCEITYKMVEKSGYAEDEVKALLQPEGLWEKVLGFDAALLKQLLADKTLPPELKKKLEALKKVTTAYPQLWLRARAAEEEE